MIPSEPPWTVEIDGISFATPESVLMLLKAVSEERDELESENDALSLDRNLYDKGWDKALDKLRIYRELLAEVGDYFKHLGMDSPASLASKVFDVLLKEEEE